MVIGFPVLNRFDLLERAKASIDIPAQVVVLDNSQHNRGVAASWNEIITDYDEPFWVIANADIEFAPGDLARLVAVMQDPSPKVACLLRFGAFAINEACVDAVGLFDENFHPIYCEDADYEYRCYLAGVPIIDLPSGTVHLEGGSVSIRQPGTDNARTYPENVRYFMAKWGGPLRGGEIYRTPFGRGGWVGDWTLDEARREALSW